MHKKLIDFLLKLNIYKLNTFTPTIHLLTVEGGSIPA